MLPRIKIQIERWKFNKEYNVYVSTLGRIKGKNKKELKIYLDQSGYQCVFTGFKVTRVHRLVMRTWRPLEDYDSMTIDHIDSNKRNCALSNLEWVSQEENLQRAISNKLTTVKVEYEIDKNRVMVDNDIYSIEQLADIIEVQRPELMRSSIVGAIKAAADGKSNKVFGMSIQYAKVAKEI